MIIEKPIYPIILNPRRVILHFFIKAKEFSIDGQNPDIPSGIEVR